MPRNVRFCEHRSPAWKRSRFRHRQNLQSKLRSALQREASRRNGSRSKGPKTPEGKARSSRNARLHALGVPAIADPAFHQQVTEFALALAGPDADPTALALATLMAAAQIDVQRARLAACAVMSGMKADSSATYSKAVRRLAWIKRYEHRCALCRDQAMRQLREWRLALGGQTTADAHQSADGRFAVASMAAEQQYARAATACEPMRCAVLPPAPATRGSHPWRARRPKAAWETASISCWSLHSSLE
jgi:hypothetical protein